MRSPAIPSAAVWRHTVICSRGASARAATLSARTAPAAPQSPYCVTLSGMPTGGLLSFHALLGSAVPRDALAHDGESVGIKIRGETRPEIEQILHLTGTLRFRGNVDPPFGHHLNRQDSTVAPD